MNLNCPSLRAFLQFGFDIPYSTLKNYYSEKRSLPEKLFEEFSNFSKIDLGRYSFEIIGDNWGQVKGGLSSKNK